MNNKKILYIAIAAIAVVLVVVLAIVFAGGNNTNNGTTNNGGNQTVEPTYKSSLELLTQILESYNATAPEEEQLWVGGGNNFNFETVSFDSPAEFVALADSDYDFHLGYPESAVSKQDDVANMFNTFNVNSFNCYAVHFKNSSDVDSMVNTLKENILDRSWECGRPEKLYIIKCPGDYLVVTWGVASYGGIIVPFAESVESIIEGASIVADVDIAAE